MKTIQIILLILIIIGITLLLTQKFWVDNLVNFILQSTTKIQPPALTPVIKEEIGSTSIWDCAKIEGCLEKWHNCLNLDCVPDIMKQYGASSDAITFTTKLLLDKGNLEQFQEMGKIDLGTVVFPDRANTNEVYYLLNGSPVLVSTEISQDKEKELTPEMKKDPLYSEMENKYPSIWFWGFAPLFVEKKSLSDSNEEFVFEYKFVNGCRICDTEYTAKIGFDFDSAGNFLKIVFLQIIKGELGG